jgi:hypothetical protein
MLSVWKRIREAWRGVGGRKDEKAVHNALQA